MTAAAASGPAPNSALTNWFDSLFLPGGNPDALDRQAEQHRQLRDAFTRHAADLTDLVQALSVDGGWSGRTADAFHHDSDDMLQRLNALAHSHELAAQGLAAQAQQKRDQQATAELLQVTLVLAVGGVALVAFAPAAAGFLGADAVVAATAGEGAEAVAESNAVLRALSQIGARVAAAADLASSFVEQLFGDALAALSDLVAQAGITRSAWQSMRLLTLLSVTGRGLAKSGNTFFQDGVHWSNVLPALVSGFDLTKWTTSDWANVLLISAAGPFIAASPLAETVAGLTLPAPLATVVGLPEGVVAGTTIGAAVDGAWWNGGFTAVGAMGVNGEPIDSPQVWSSTATSTALGTGAGMAAQTFTNWRDVQAETAGLDATKFWRSLIALPADVGIAAGTAAPPPSKPMPAPPPEEPPAPQQFQPQFSGGKKVKVKPGESLSEIAQRDLGDANLWPALQTANPDPVDGHPDLIHPDDEIVVPLLPAPEERQRRH